LSAESNYLKNAIDFCLWIQFSAPSSRKVPFSSQRDIFRERLLIELHHFWICNFNFYQIYSLLPTPGIFVCAILCNSCLQYLLVKWFVKFHAIFYAIEFQFYLFILYLLHTVKSGEFNSIYYGQIA
jgi:hypothetical protein